MLKSWLLRWHRPLAIMAAIPVLAWSLTGLLHPIMSRWQPSAVAMKPPAELFAAPAGVAWSDLPPPARTLPTGMDLRELRAMTWQGQPYWLAQTANGERRYYHAQSGALASIESSLVVALARHYTGAQTPILSVSEVRQHSHEYPFVNRYLPVWRVAFDQPDGLVAFIEPRSLQLTGLTDTWKTRFSALFSNLHSWTWWPHAPSRDVAMVMFLSAAGLLMISGLVRAVVMPTTSARTTRQRWHRRLGWWVAAAALAWIGSAVFHVLVINKGQPSFATYPLTYTFKSDAIQWSAPPITLPQTRLQVIATSTGSAWRAWALEHAHSASGSAAGHHASPAHPPKLHDVWMSAETGEPMLAATYLRDLTKSIANSAAPKRVQAVTQFTPEYGFVQKRLPVYEMQFAQDVSVYVDPADAAVVTVVRPLDRIEGFSFAYLHKGHWFDFLGKTMRDTLLGLFALLVLITVVFGVSLLRSTKVSP